MRDVLILLVHLIVTLIRLASPGGIRAVVAESVLVKHQLVILNRSRKRAPNLHALDRIIAVLCALLMHPARVVRCAIVLRPSTLLHFHHILVENIGYCFRQSREADQALKDPRKNSSTRLSR